MDITIRRATVADLDAVDAVAPLSDACRRCHGEPVVLPAERGGDAVVAEDRRRYALAVDA